MSQDIVERLNKHADHLMNVSYAIRNGEDQGSAIPLENAAVDLREAARRLRADRQPKAEVVAIAAAATPGLEALTFGYTNHRGEHGIRRALPLALWYGTTKWHPEPQWFMRAHDLDKDEERDFAIRDFGQPKAEGAPVAFASPALVNRNQATDHERNPYTLVRTSPDEAMSIALFVAPPSPEQGVEVDAMRTAIERAIDLLLERVPGSPARSSSHNARVVLQAALLASPRKDAGEAAHASPATEMRAAVNKLRDFAGDLPNATEVLPLLNPALDHMEAVAGVREANMRGAAPAKPDAMRAALKSAIHIAAEIQREWDADNDPRVGKLLIALAGGLPGYRKDIDAIHAALSATAEEKETAEADTPAPAASTSEIEGWQQRMFDDATMPADGFDIGYFQATLLLLLSDDDKIVKAALSNNLNTIIAALRRVIAAEPYPPAESDIRDEMK